MIPHLEMLDFHCAWNARVDLPKVLMGICSPSLKLLTPGFPRFKGLDYGFILAQVKQTDFKVTGWGKNLLMKSIFELSVKPTLTSLHISRPQCGP